VKKLNVLQVIPALGFGGAERQVVTLAGGLDRSRYAPIVCCLRRRGPLAATLDEQGIPVIELRWRTRYLPISLLRLILLMRSLQVDIVHTHLFEAGLWGRIAAKLAGICIIVHTEHGLNPWKKRQHIWYERLADRFTDKRITVSEDIRQSRIHREGLSPENLVVIPNTIDLAHFDPTLIHAPETTRQRLGLRGSNAVVGTVARLSHEKGITYLLRAAETVARACPDVHFLIVGDGPLRESLEVLAEQVGLRNSVVFTGARSGIRELLAVMDVFVLPSLREGIPVSLLEAMAMKRAVIATDVGGTPEVLRNNSGGILVPPADVGVLAEAMIGLLQDPQRRTRLGEAARERVRETFSSEVCIRQIEHLYEELLESKIRSPQRARGNPRSNLPG